MTREQLAPLLRKKDGGILLSCHVQPGASRSAIVGLYGASVKIALAAPPVDGKANKELCVFLAKKLGLPKSAVSLAAGAASRDKKIFLPESAEAALLEILP